MSDKIKLTIETIVGENRVVKTIEGIGLADVPTAIRMVTGKFDLGVIEPSGVPPNETSKYPRRVADSSRLGCDGKVDEISAGIFRWTIIQSCDGRILHMGQHSSIGVAVDKMEEHLRYVSGKLMPIPPPNKEHIM